MIATEPIAAEPTVAELTAAEPTATEPAAAEPTVAEPTAAEPAAAVEPAADSAASAEPAATEPAAAERVAAEPATAAEPTAEPAAAEPTPAVVTLSSPLTLPCGTVLPGRIVKAAMTESLADEWNNPTPELCRLYSAWSKNHNAGHVLITGNIQVDRRYLERPGNVVIDTQCADPEKRLELLKQYAAAAQQDGTKCLAQISHAGRQSDVLVNLASIGPSAIKSECMVPLSKPREMTDVDIEDVVVRFANAARVCKEAGFAGVQLHAAHGYLFSQFLSPLANQRTDKYGGGWEARSLLLVRVVRACREAVGPEYCIAVKLNSSDFQKGGFSEDDAVQIAVLLEKEGVDLLEISGGNYENPAMGGGPTALSEVKFGKAKRSTVLREGFFLQFAEKMRQSLSKMPLMVTGGFRSKAFMEETLQSGACELIGIGRPVAGEPDCIFKLLQGEISELPRYESMLQLPWHLRWLKYVYIGHILELGAPQFCLLHNMQRIAHDEPKVAPEKWNLVSDLGFVNALAKSQARKLQGIDESVVGKIVNNGKPKGILAKLSPKKA